MKIPILIAFFSVCFCNYLYCLIAYDVKYESKPVVSYILGSIAATVSIISWMYLVRQYRDPNTIMIVNVIWDVGGTIALILWPFILYDFKIDTKTIIGCVIAIIGIIITKI